ncbi:MAG: TonB family protein [bacterium]|nr:TonB family protein [bacterium]
MESKINYFNQTMNEIVFESKNKTYGAFQLRKLYAKNHKRALIFVLSIFVLSTAAPFLITYLNLFNEDIPLIIETKSYDLTAPQSIKPLVPIKPPPPKIDEVKEPTEKFIEIEAAKKDQINDPPPPKIIDLAKKEIGNIKKDSVDKNTSDSKNDNASDNSGEGKVWNRLEHPPKFIGGEDAYAQFLFDNLDYPLEAEKKKIEGTARLYFVVTQDGSIEQITIIKSTGNKLLDEEAIRVISIQPKYKPGTQNGHPVKAGFVQEISFSIPQ